MVIGSDPTIRIHSETNSQYSDYDAVGRHQRRIATTTDTASDRFEPDSRRGPNGVGSTPPTVVATDTPRGQLAVAPLGGLPHLDDSLLAGVIANIPTGNLSVIWYTEWRPRATHLRWVSLCLNTVRRHRLNPDGVAAGPNPVIALFRSGQR